MFLAPNPSRASRTLTTWANVIPPGCTMAEPNRTRAPLPVALDRDDEPTSPDTPAAQTELVEAIEWLKKKGIVSDSKPPFAGFYEELVDE